MAGHIFGGPVAGTVVDDDHRQCDVLLAEHRAEGSRQELTPVLRGDHHRHVVVHVLLTAFVGIPGFARSKLRSGASVSPRLLVSAADVPRVTLGCPELLDGCLAGGEDVGARAAGAPVGTSRSGEAVGSAPTVQVVVADATEQLIVAVAAVEGVIVLEADELVVAEATVEQVVPEATAD